MCIYLLTSRLCRLQAQNLADVTPSIGKVSPIQQNRYNFWTSDAMVMSFRIKRGLYQLNIVYLINWRAISNRLGMAAPKICGRKRITEWLAEIITKVLVEQPLASPGSAKNLICCLLSKIGQLGVLLWILNLEGHQNLIICSKVTIILTMFLIHD